MDTNNKQQQIQLQKQEKQNEILFWKVFHNKYIFLQILRFIESVEWCQSETVGDNNLEKRKKFKDIISLSWMIENNQYELLKCKLQVPDELIIIEDQALHYLFCFDRREQENEFNYQLNDYINNNNNNINNSQQDELIVTQDKEKREPLKKNEKDYYADYFCQHGFYRIRDEDKISPECIKAFSTTPLEAMKEIELLKSKTITNKNDIELIHLLLKHKWKELSNFNLIKILFQQDDQKQRDSKAILYPYNELIGLLTSEPYSLPIYPSTLEHSILNFPTSTVAKIIELPTNNTTIGISNSTRNKSLSLASKNKYYSEEMLEFILNHPQLYNIKHKETISLDDQENDKVEILGNGNGNKKTTTTTTTTAAELTTTIFNKKFKKLDGSSISTTGSSVIILDDDDEISEISEISEIIKEEIILIDVVDFLKIKNKDLQIKLFQLNYVKPLVIHGTLNKFGINSNTEERIKELYRAFIKSSLYSNKHIGVYLNYLQKYNEPIKGLSSSTFLVVLKYSLESFSVVTLKYLNSMDQDTKLNLLNEKVKHYNGNYTGYSNRLFGSNDYPIYSGMISKEFIKLYTSVDCYKYFNNSTCDEKIKDYIFWTVKSRDEYFQLYQSLGNDSYIKRELPSNEWSDIESIPFKLPLSKKLNIENEQVGNWLIENYHYLKSLYCHIFNHEGFTIDSKTFKFQTKQLTTTIFTKLLNTTRYSENHFVTVNQLENSIQDKCTYPFTISLNQCDIESLKSFDCDQFQYKKFKKLEIPESSSTNTIKKAVRKVKRSYIDINIFNIFGGDTSNKLNFKGQTTSTINQLLEYLNSTGYISFSPILYKQFIKCIAAAANNEIDLSSLVNLGFNQFIRESIQLFVGSITDYKSPNLMELILNNQQQEFNFFTTKELFDQLAGEWNSSSVDKLDKSFFHYFKGVGHFKAIKHSTLYFVEALIGFEENPQINFCVSGESVVDIIKCIELLLGYFDKLYPTLSFPSNNEVVELIQKMINHLIRRLIRSEKVGVSRFKTIYQKIIESWDQTTKSEISFRFEHTLYHSLYYLSVRSLKFINYIMSTPAAPWYIEEMGGFYNLDTIQYETAQGEPNPEYYSNFENGDVLKHLNPRVFTYEFIFNAPFSEILEKLIHHLVYMSIINENGQLIQNNQLLNQNQNLYFGFLDCTLSFLIDMKEIDLFFKQLDIIETQLNDPTIVIGEFPVIMPPAIVSQIPYTECCTHLKPIVNGRIVEFSEQLIIDSSKVMDSEQFSRLISFNSYQSIKHLFTNGFNFNQNESDSVILDIFLKHTSLVDHVAKNHYNLPDFWNSTVFNKPIDGDVIFTEENQFTNAFNSCYFQFPNIFKYSKLINQFNIVVELNINQFQNVVCYYPTLNNKFYKYNPQLDNNMGAERVLCPIDFAIKHNNINYLKYIYQDPSTSKSDLKIIKSKLLKHFDFKFVNWLK